jgi:hypothetical protein
VVDYWADPNGRPARTRGLKLVNLTNGKRVHVERSQLILEVAGWRTNANQLEGIVFTGHDFATNRAAFLLHLADGRLIAAPPDIHSPDPRLLLSGDGRWSVERAGKDKLLFTDLISTTKREFKFSAADAQQIIGDRAGQGFQWVSNRYLMFVRDPPALIDSETFDMTTILPDPNGVNLQGFSPDFAYARGANRNGEYLGKVQLR